MWCETSNNSRGHDVVSRYRVFEAKCSVGQAQMQGVSVRPWPNPPAYSADCSQSIFFEFRVPAFRVAPEGINLANAASFLIRAVAKASSLTVIVMNKGDALKGLDWMSRRLLSLTFGLGHICNEALRAVLEFVRRGARRTGRHLARNARAMAAQEDG